MSDSPVSLIGNGFVEEVGGSFTQPLTDPGVDPTAGPLVCIPLNRSWKPFLAGAALQLLLPASWEYADETALNTVLDRAVLVLEAIAFATICDEAGVISLTILAGNASVSGAVTFPYTFAATPIIVVSSNDPTLIASWSAATTSGFTATITAHANLDTNRTATLSWVAKAAT